MTKAYPYNIRNVLVGNIRLRCYVSVNTFKYRAMIAYNRVPAQLKVGNWKLTYSKKEVEAVGLD